MAVAALSSSAIALAAGPAAQPAPAPAGAQGGEAAGAFATLVTRAEADGKAPQGEARPGGTEAETETADAADDSASLSSDGETGDKSTDKPLDLLAEIEAMVAAAGQLGFGAPVPVATAPAIPVPTTAVSGAKTVIGTSDALPTAATPALAVAAASLPVAADTSLPATSPNQPAPAADPTGPADTPAPTGEVPPESRDSKPAKATRGNIAAIIASLKTAFSSAPSADVTPAMPAAAPAAPPIVLPGTGSVPPAGAAPVAAGDGRKADSSTIKATGDNATTVEAQVMTAPATPAPVKPRADKPVASKTASDDGIRPAHPAALVPPSAAAAADSDVPDSRRTDNRVPDGNRVPDAAALAAAPVAADNAPIAQATAAPADLSTAPVAGAAVAAPNHGEQSVNRHLDLARDNQWLDQLARDISQAATQQGHLKFQLNPEHLGALTVEIANSASGTAIRMTADTDHARAIIADAQPRLLAEVRAQGLRVAESHVDLNQQGSGGSALAQGQQQQQQQQQSSADHKPFARTQAAVRDAAGDSAPHDDGELYA